MPELGTVRFNQQVQTLRFIQTIPDCYIKDDTPEEQAEKARLLALVTLREKQEQQEAEEKRLAEERDRNRVFAKSCLQGEGCNDAGEEQEPHTNFAAMAFYQAVPPADPASDTDVPQHAQTAKKKKPVEDIPKPKKRSALYKWLNGNHEEIEYQRATAAATSAANAQMAVEGASVLGLVGGSAITSGTWAVKLGEMAIWLAFRKAWRFLLQYQLSAWRASSDSNVGKKLIELSLPTLLPTKASGCQ